jgi:hypothetical protein
MSYEGYTTTLLNPAGCRSARRDYSVEEVNVE